jgi:hypothetical protein
MGFLDSDNSSDIANEQYQQQQAELERKKADLYKTRLDIIKSQGGQQWTPDVMGGNNQAVGYGPNANPVPGKGFLPDMINKAIKSRK